MEKKNGKGIEYHYGNEWKIALEIEYSNGVRKDDKKYLIKEYNDN